MSGSQVLPLPGADFMGIRTSRSPCLRQSLSRTCDRKLLVMRHPVNIWSVIRYGRLSYRPWVPVSGRSPAESRAHPVGFVGLNAAQNTTMLQTLSITWPWYLWGRTDFLWGLSTVRCDNYACHDRRLYCLDALHTRSIKPLCRCDSIVLSSWHMLSYPTKLFYRQSQTNHAFRVTINRLNPVLSAVTSFIRLPLRDPDLIYHR